ncbi:MAG: LPD5 domain-containing protein, partial [Gammaproteobacteria bacterium]
MARKRIDREKESEKNKETAKRLDLRVGENVGRIKLQDGKLALAATVEKLDEETVTMHVVRGPTRGPITMAYTSLERFADRAGNDYFTRKASEEQPASSETEPTATPHFETYSDAQSWINQKSIEYGGKKKFSASDEYKSAYDQVQALYTSQKKKSDAEAMQALSDAGLSIGDTVSTTISGAFMTQDELAGEIVNRNGRPYVKLEQEIPVSRNGKISYQKSVSWDSRWKGTEKKQSKATAPGPTEGEVAPVQADSGPESKQSVLDQYLSEVDSPMQRGKLKASLEQTVGRRDSQTGKVYQDTRDAVMLAMINDGWTPKSAKIPKLKEKSRREWFGMDNEQQRAFEKRRSEAGTKTEYTIETEDGRSFVITKAEHDYAVWLKGRESEPSVAKKPEAEEQKPASELDLFKSAVSEFTDTVKQATEAIKPAKPAEKIEDFGEVIHGAKKHTYTQRLEDAKSVDIAAVPLSKSWPEPDYQKLIDEGIDSWIVSFTRAARDEIPTKPKKSWKLKGWVEKVESLRGFAEDLLNGEISKDKVKHALTVQKNLDEAVGGRADLYEAVGHEHSLKGIRLSSGQYSMLNGVEYKPAKTLWSVSKSYKSTAFGNWPSMIATGETRQEAIDNFKKKVKSGGLEKQKASKQVRFDIYSTRGDKKVYFIGKKIGRRTVRMKEFDDLKSAREYLQTHQADLEEQLSKYKDVPAMRRPENAPRVGEDHRGGADVRPEQFGETFGFRGVQFGNWVENDRRQKDLNEAYDALMDLAGVLNIPPKALSLNGELGLAFGARGTGGKDAAAAHYEPGQVVINLTKKAGPGSLAHEWFHGLDNYFSRMRGDKGDYLTERAYPRGEGVRPEMVEAFKQIYQAVNKTKLRQRSAMLERKAKDYWTTGREMTARSFESYIIAKLQDEGLANDYLANIVSEDYWEAAAALGLELEGSYPYPQAAEIPVIREAFDNFFEVVETKETDQGVALFSLDDDQTSTPEFSDWFGDSKVVDENGDPKVMYRGDYRDPGDTFRAVSTEEGGSGAIYFTDEANIASGYTTKPYMEGNFDDVLNNTTVTIRGRTKPLNRANISLRESDKKKITDAVLTVGETDTGTAINADDPSVGKLTWNEHLSRSGNNHLLAANSVLL